MTVPTTVPFPVELPAVKKGERWIARSGDKELRLSNLDKVYFPERGFTKGDLIAYYFNISPTMLPHVARRPLTRKRMPNGIHGEFFFEKNAPAHTPPWIEVLAVPAEEGTKTIRYVTVNDAADMIWLANLGCIEFHPLHARGLDQEHPDYAFFDLDPMGDAGWDQVRYVAGLVKVVLDQLEVPSYPKTSGATGMQIMVPLDRSADYIQVRRFVGAVSTMVHQADPEATSMEWEVKKRGTSIYLDVNMNRSGANIAAAYSVRPEPDATVSAPFAWDELGEIVPGDFTIESIFQRVAEVGDLFAPVAEGPGIDLAPVLARLEPVIEAFNITGAARVFPR